MFLIDTFSSGRKKLGVLLVRSAQASWARLPYLRCCILWKGGRLPYDGFRTGEAEASARLENLFDKGCDELGLDYM